MLSENNVVGAVASYLRANGYRIDSQLTTIDRGIDIKAFHLETELRLLVEAKVGTSSKSGTKRYGKPFSEMRRNPT